MDAKLWERNSSGPGQEVVVGEVEGKGGGSSAKLRTKGTRVKWGDVEGPHGADCPHNPPPPPQIPPLTTAERGVTLVERNSFFFCSRRISLRRAPISLRL